MLTILFHSNWKKLFNHIDRTTKYLVIGRYHVTKAAIFAVMRAFPSWKHKIRSSDPSSKRNRQNVPPIEHMTSDVRLLLLLLL